MAVGVIVETLDVQTSFAPIRIVMYSAPWKTAMVTWPPSAFIRAPVFASLKLRPLIAAFAARMRR